jgi:hypothetical protein
MIAWLLSYLGGLLKNERSHQKTHDEEYVQYLNRTVNVSPKNKIIYEEHTSV